MKSRSENNQIREDFGASRAQGYVKKMLVEWIPETPTTLDSLLSCSNNFPVP